MDSAGGPSQMFAAKDSGSGGGFPTEDPGLPPFIRVVCVGGDPLKLCTRRRIGPAGRG